MSKPRKRPGYVYILSNPALDGWFKIGRTQKPPYKRVKALSGTSSPLDFEIVYVRYFLDCVSAEYNIHTQLEKKLGSNSRRKEFFNGEKNFLIEVLSSIKDITLEEAVKERIFTDLPDNYSEFNHIYDYNKEIDIKKNMDSLFYKSKIKILSPAKQLNDMGSKELEILSNMGHGLSTWHLANYLLKNPKMSNNEISWLFDIAEMQGVTGGRLKGSWIRSAISEDWKFKWIFYLDVIWNDYRNKPYHTWGDELREILELEIMNWHQKRKKIFYHKIWEFIFKELYAKEDKNIHEIKCLWILENIAFKNSKII